jgi:hypothetical protein
LGSRTRQRLTRVWAKREARESHLMLPRMCENLNEWTPTLPSELPPWELESCWSLVGVPNFQRVIARVKTNWIEKKIISLESS